MKKFFQGSHKIMLFSNIFVSLLCTSYLFTGYINVDVNNDIHHDKTAKVIDNDMEVVSQSGKKSNKVTNVTKVTSVVTRKNVNTSNKNYTPAQYNAVTGTAIVNYAKKYLGLRYVSGGNSLETGTDCSGFTKLIYKEFGVNLSRTVKSQVNNGSYIRKSDLQKGDLVFYSKGGSSVSHVAIYIGNGQVIHESNYRDGVKISSVNMMTYITARRVINQTANEIAADKLNEENKQNSTTNDVINNSTDTSSDGVTNNTNISNNDTTTSTNPENSVEQNNSTNNPDVNNGIVEDNNEESNPTSNTSGSSNEEASNNTSSSEDNSVYTTGEY